MSYHRIACIAVFLLLPLIADAQDSVKSQVGATESIKTALDAIKNVPEKQATMAVDLIRSRSLEKMPWQEQIELLPYLDSYDKLDKQDMSVRWSGKITAPTSGHYIFSQLRTYYTDGTMRLWINGNLVMESKGSGLENKEWESNPNVNDPSFKSSGVPLSAGAPADFLLEYSHNMKDVKIRRTIPMGFPVAVLLWESDVMEQNVVPKEVFTVPAGKQSGLHAEYYADSSFSRKVGERIDQTVDFVWDQEPVFNDFSSYRRSIVKANIPRVSNAGFLTSLNDEDAANLAQNGLTKLLEGMTSTERSSLIDVVSTQPRLLKEIPYKDLETQMRFVHMLPGKKHYSLLIKWSEVNHATRSIPGTIINGSGTYEERNILPHRRIGRLFGKPYAEDIDTLISDHLESEDGTCNLALAYVVLCACKENNNVAVILKRIDVALGDEEIIGDARASWLLVRAFASEIAIPPVPRIGRGLRDLNEALAAAESETMRFRVFQEIVARLISLGQKDEAESLVTSIRGQFQDQARQAEIDSWLTSAEEIQGVYAEKNQELQESRRQKYLSSLKTNRDRAKSRDDAVQFRKMQKILVDNSTSP